MRAKTEQRVRRWNDQRWVIDSVIQAIGMEWDQPRLNYTLYPCGPDASGDFRAVGARVRKFADIHRELAAAARRREIRAEAFETQGRFISAGESYFIASLLWSAARWPIFENNETSIHYNARTVACYDKFAKYAAHPVERIEVPFGKGRVLPGYLHLPRAPKPGEKFPCVISVDGMDGSKEILCSMYGDKFLERGFANFIYDGPGQGECTISEIFVTPTNHMDAARAVHQCLARHPHIDSGRMVATGVSFGSFFALQIAAALGDRLKGTAVSMVCHQPGGHAIMDMASPSYKMRFMYMAGFEDERKFDAFMRKFTLMPLAGKIKCPVLIQGGDDDELSPIEFSHALVSKIKTPKKFVVYEGERHAMGGGSAAQLGENWFTMLADWCLDRVDGKNAPNEHVFVNALGQAKTTSYR
jgi:dienelactone hydrolase